MKKNLLLVTLLTLTLTACEKTAEEEVPESTVAVEETIIEESTIEEESTAEEEETLSMTEEEIVAFLEQVRDMDYDSYTFRKARYYTDRTDSEGNPMDDHTWEDTWISVDEDGNILEEEKQNTADKEDLVDDTYAKHYFLEDGTYATNYIDSANVNWKSFKEGTETKRLAYAKFFDLFSITDEDIAIVVQKSSVSEYNGRPALHVENLLDYTEETFLQFLYADADTLKPENGSLTFDIYLYLDTPGEYISIQTVRYSTDELTCTVHLEYELTNVNNTELSEIPENYIRY